MIEEADEDHHLGEGHALDHDLVQGAEIDLEGHVLDAEAVVVNMMIGEEDLLSQNDIDALAQDHVAVVRDDLEVLVDPDRVRENLDQETDHVP